MKTDTAGLAALPKIVQFVGMTDGGPCDDGPTAVCPHCGADGRYVYWFRCDDGTTRGAMRGCLQLFPVSQVAREDLRLVEREADLRKRYGADATLNSWDTRCREALDAYYAGAATIPETLATVARERAAMAAWRQRKHGNRH